MKLKSSTRGKLKKLKRDKVLYLLLMPTIVYFVIFRLLPILNMKLAFYDYRSVGPWHFAGLKYFKLIFKSPSFVSIVQNTLIISFMKYVLLFPFVVGFAILLTEVKSNKFRKYVQVISFLPHFLSWVVIAGVWIAFLSPSVGAANEILGIFHIAPIDFMTDKERIRWVLLFSEAWRSIGWDSIIYFTVIITISPNIIESARIDGANRFNIIKHIVLPALVAPMVTMFILNLGFFLNAGFDQVFNFTNDSVNSVIDILDTYIYRIGLINGQYSLATAVGVLKGIIGVFLVLETHLISKRVSGKGVW